MDFIKSRKVSTGDLQVGMYVAELDRPWLEAPFVLQGFMISTEEEIQLLQEHCKYVYVDEKSYLAVNYTVHQKRKKNTSPAERKNLLEESFGKKLKTYSDQVSWQEEYPVAQKALGELSRKIDEIFKAYQSGGSLDVARVKLAVDPMIDSISRNPDACIWLARMEQADEYIFQHSLGSSIWAVALGRQLGLGKTDLRSLAVGCLLFDVGKLQLDQELLQQPRRFNAEEFDLVKSHVQLGVDAVRKTEMINEDILAIISFHHERFNGHGYPQGLKGDKIPVFARVAAIADCYDAITRQRPYANAMSPAQAIKKLYEWRGIDFQAELVEEFIQAIGIYPAGSLVELSSGEIAVVIAEYRSRRLRPQVMLLLDADKKPVNNVVIDLLEHTENKDGSPLEIIHSLEPEAFGIDMQSIQL